MRPEQRRGIENAIWLCQNHAKLVDNDPVRFPAPLLREWRANAEAEAFAAVGMAGMSSDSPVAAARLALLDSRFKMVVDDYLERGSPKFMIDTFDDLTIEEKAALYDRAVMWKKQRSPRENPYRTKP
jgi:hypothetical protein